MSNTDKLREIATRNFPVEEKLSNNSLYNQLQQSSQDNLLSDLTALISEGYVEKAKYDEAVRQRDELREALIDMVWQFAYEGTKNGKGVMYTGGLSALEGAFSALGLSDDKSKELLSDLTALIPITVEDFEAAIKNTDG